MDIIRVLVAKPGLDGHDRGAKIVARGLRDQGFEVIYTGLHQTPEMVANAVIQEDVDVVGLSILSGAHISLVESIRKILKQKGVDKPMFVGGIIPAHDARQLSRLGVMAVFGPGATITDIANKIKEVVGESSPKASKGKGVVAGPIPKASKSKVKKNKT